MLRTYLLAISLLTLLVASCTPKTQYPDPDALPSRLTQVHTWNVDVRATDLDGDGRDELVSTTRPLGDGIKRGAIQLKTHDRKTIDQINFAGRVGNPQFIDLDGDRILEILVPHVRGDSLFFTISDAQGHKQGHFFVTAGTPRLESDGGVIPWDPSVRDAFFEDVNGDGTRELITVVVTQYARLPRGVWIHSIPDGQELGHFTVGAILNPGTSYVEDVDRDGRLELLFSASSSNNGAAAGGMDDQHSYVGAFDLGSPPTMQWKRTLGGLWTAARLYRGHFEQGEPTYLAIRSSGSGRPAPTQLQLIDPATGRSNRSLTLDEPTLDVIPIDLNQDGETEILTLGASGNARVFSGAFELKRERDFPSVSGAEQHVRLNLWPDADGDGVREIVVETGWGSYFLGQDLEVKAALPSAHIDGTFRQGVGQRPLLTAWDAEADRTRTYRLEPNPGYLWHRYGRPGLGLLGLLAAIAGGLGIWRLYRRHRLLTSTQTLIEEADDRGLMLLDPSGQSRRMNASAWRLLHLNGRSSEPLELDVLRKRAPQLATFLAELPNGSPHRHEHTLTLHENGTVRPVHVQADPLSVGLSGQPYWLVQLRDRASSNSEQYRTWGLMARRVAHDLKNPLTSIQLKLQRMQMEYQRHAPGLAGRLDPYAEQVLGRIDELRRMTRTFMKFVDAEALSRAPTDLNAWLQECAGTTLQDMLPPDIDLALELGDDVPRVEIDREQMQSVLDNLIANAVEALPEGGRITLRTHSAEALSFPEAPEPRDYAVLEIMDTGIGMNEAVRQHLFEPGFSTAEDGTGLGLAIVHKIVGDHGGRVEVESEPGTGTVFSIYLPVS